MNFIRRIRETVLLIGCSLFPSLARGYFCGGERRILLHLDMTAGDSTPGPGNASDTRETIRVTETDGSLNLYFPLVYPISAPFVLYRLKRTGFSGCRAVAEHNGLKVTATR